MGNMGSAHPLDEVNISAKFEENPSIYLGFIERINNGDGQTGGRTDRPTDGRDKANPLYHYSPPPHFVGVYSYMKRLVYIWVKWVVIC